MPRFERITVVDSHTGGEPTRVVLDGIPDLGTSSLADRCRRFAAMTRYRERIIMEPRGSDILVGAILVPPDDATCSAGVIFFNNVGVLGMCGHGTIGLAVTLAHLGRIQPGLFKLETPAGIVSVTLHDKHHATVTNVPSFREGKDVPVDVPGLGRVVGDIAYGGNWFFLTHLHGEDLDRNNTGHLTETAWKIRQCVDARIDHIELTGPPKDPRNSGRNFVLCPGKVYDRSPCGTGTSAKVACLASDSKLAPGEIWRQESITGSVFEASYEIIEGAIVPRITGAAFITAEATLHFDADES